MSQWMRKTILITIIVCMLPACATFYPEVKKTTPVPSGECQLVTKKLELNHTTHNASCRDNNPAAIFLCLGLSGLYTATTAIISGSVVLAGNTIHWIEKQGRCKSDTDSLQANTDTPSVHQNKISDGENQE